jgi:cell division transport system permease protein
MGISMWTDRLKAATEALRHQFDRMAKPTVEADPPEASGLPANLKRDMPLVPVDGPAGRALIAVIAILTFLAALAAGSAAMVSRASNQWQGSVGQEMTIQIRPDPRRDMEADLARAAALARAEPGITEARIVPRGDSDRLLEPWLGRGLALSELPIPRLIVLRLGPKVKPEFPALRQTLARELPGASLDDHKAWVARLSTMANTLVVAGFTIVLLTLAAAALAVAFATRGAMAGSRESVDVLHFVGADDAFIAREFQGRFVRLGLEGGAIGGALALVTIAVMGWFAAAWSAGPDGSQLEALFGAFEIGWQGYGSVILVAATVSAIAGLVSGLTVRRQLARMV